MNREITQEQRESMTQQFRELPADDQERTLQFIDLMQDARRAGGWREIYFDSIVYGALMDDAEREKAIQTQGAEMRAAYTRGDMKRAIKALRIAQGDLRKNGKADAVDCADAAITFIRRDLLRRMEAQA